jgi:hypothetical protein
VSGLIVNRPLQPGDQLQTREAMLVGLRPGFIRTSRPGDVIRQLAAEITPCEVHGHCGCKRCREHCCACGTPKGRWWK